MYRGEEVEKVDFAREMRLDNGLSNIDRVNEKKIIRKGEGLTTVSLAKINIRFDICVGGEMPASWSMNYLQP